MKKYLAFLTVLLVVVLNTMLVSAQDVEEVELPPSGEFLLDFFGGDFENYGEFIHSDWTWEHLRYSPTDIIQIVVKPVLHHHYRRQHVRLPSLYQARRVPL